MKQIKHILTSNRHIVLHKRQQYSINQIKKVLENINLALVKADKSKAIVIIDRGKRKETVNDFIKENHINLLNEDPTEIYKKTSSSSDPKMQHINRYTDP